MGTVVVFWSLFWTSAEVCASYGISVLILRLGSLRHLLIAQKRKEGKALDSSGSWDQWLVLHCSAQCSRGPSLPAGERENAAPSNHTSLTSSHQTPLTDEGDFCGASEIDSDLLGQNKTLWQAWQRHFIRRVIKVPTGSSIFSCHIGTKYSSSRV